MIFVSVGNAHNPFLRLVEAADLAAARTSERVIIQSGHTRYRACHAEQVSFLGIEEYDALVAEARLLIAHAGCGSVIAAFRLGKPLILMPRRKCFGEHVNDHQLELAAALAGDPRVQVVETSAELEAAMASPPQATGTSPREPALLAVLQAWMSSRFGV